MIGDARRLVATLAAPYLLRRPTETVLYQLVRANLESFLAYAREHYDGGLPRYVERELRAYLRCGVFSEGFVRCRCDACGHDLLVAFSCKSRTVFPSCAGRRMANAAATIVDRVLPDVPLRQYVLTLPYELRAAKARRLQGRRTHGAGAHLRRGDPRFGRWPSLPTSASWGRCPSTTGRSAPSAWRSIARPSRRRAPSWPTPRLRSTPGSGGRSRAPGRTASRRRSRCARRLIDAWAPFPLGSPSRVDESMDIGDGGSSGVRSRPALPSEARGATWGDGEGSPT
jgi:hypothetical protein